MTIDLDALRKKHAELNKPRGAGGNNDEFLKKFFQVQDGNNVVRILPGINDRQFYSETKIHRVPTADGNTKNVHCRKVQGEACPLCDLYYSLWKTTGSKEKVAADQALARQIKPRERYYLNVLDRATNEVKIFSTGKIVMNKIISSILDEDIGDITNPETGHDFKIHKVMEGQWPKYDQSAPRPKPSALGTKQEIAAALELRHDIYTLVKLEDYEEVKKIAETLAVGGSVAAPSRAASVEVSDEDYMDKLQA